MQRLHYQIVPLHRHRPLRISRGISGEIVCVWLRVESEGIEGWGAACPFSTGRHVETSREILETLEQIAPLIADCSPLDRQRISGILHTKLKGPSLAALAALDTALMDWLGKRTGFPLWRLLGLELSAIPPTSVTIGVERPDTAAGIARDWLEGDMCADRLQPGKGKKFKILKVKLGNPDGTDADMAMLEAVMNEAGDAEVIVDANAGWDLKNACEMCRRLEKWGIGMVEQPLPDGEMEQWRKLHETTSLNIFADESCFSAGDVGPLSECVDGIVIKSMKCGGLSEAIKFVNTARSLGLLVMLGCYSETLLSNSAMAQIAPLVDYVDLDSHFNLKNDPFYGAELRDGKLVPGDLPGIGVELKNA